MGKMVKHDVEENTDNILAELEPSSYESKTN